MNCEECVYYVYDDEDEEYYCSVDMDQDDYVRVMSYNAARGIPISPSFLR